MFAPADNRNARSMDAVIDDPREGRQSSENSNDPELSRISGRFSQPEITRIVGEYKQPDQKTDRGNKNPHEGRRTMFAELTTRIANSFDHAKPIGNNSLTLQYKVNGRFRSRQVVIPRQECPRSVRGSRAGTEAVS